MVSRFELLKALVFRLEGKTAADMTFLFVLLQNFLDLCI